MAFSTTEAIQSEIPALQKFHQLLHKTVDKVPAVGKTVGTYAYSGTGPNYEAAHSHKTFAEHGTSFFSDWIGLLFSYTFLKYDPQKVSGDALLKSLDDLIKTPGKIPASITISNSMNRLNLLVDEKRKELLNEGYKEIDAKKYNDYITPAFTAYDYVL